MTSTGRLLLVAVVLVILVLVFANPFQDSVRQGNPERVEVFDPSRLGDVDEIVIRSPSVDPAVLKRTGDEWVVASKDGFPADTSAVGTMLRAIRGAKSFSVASTNPANRGKFQVDSTGVEIVASAGGAEVAHFTVGRMGQDFTTSYLRRDGSDDVLVVRGLNRNIFSRAQGYRDRTLLRFETTEVQTVSVKTPEEQWEITRGDTAWTVQRPGDAEGTRMKTETAEQLVRFLSTLSADGFLDDPADTVQTGLEDPEYSVVVRLMNGSESGIVVGGKNASNQRYVSRPDRQVVYLMGDWRMNNVAKKYDDLVAS